MLLFFNKPEMSCISGNDIPSLSIHVGTAASPGGSCPGFGWNSGEDRSCVEQHQPM